MIDALPDFGVHFDIITLVAVWFFSGLLGAYLFHVISFAHKEVDQWTRYRGVDNLRREAIEEYLRKIEAQRRE